MPEKHTADRHRPLPLYAQIKEALRERILEGDYCEPREFLPKVN
jgi:DNA-binding GntR family transcriptional regulator